MWFVVRIFGSTEKKVAKGVHGGEPAGTCSLSKQSWSWPPSPAVCGGRSHHRGLSPIRCGDRGWHWLGGSACESKGRAYRTELRTPPKEPGTLRSTLILICVLAGKRSRRKGRTCSCVVSPEMTQLRGAWAVGSGHAERALHRHCYLYLLAWKFQLAGVSSGLHMSALSLWGTQVAFGQALTG